MSDEFKFEVGDSAYVFDALSKASRSVYRVMLLDRQLLAGIARYLVVPVRCLDSTPYWIRQDALDPEPRAYRMNVAARRQWLDRSPGLTRKEHRDNSNS